MKKQAYNIDALARIGKRWFARPPEGFEPPSKSAICDVSIYAAMLQNCPIGQNFELVFAALQDPELSTRLTYLYNMQNWIRTNGPTIFVDKDILDKCEHTDALGCIQGSDIKTVYPVWYLSLPKNSGFVSKQTGDTLRHIWVNILEPDKPLPYWINGTQYNQIRVPGRRLFMQGYWNNTSDVSSFSLPLDFYDKNLFESLEESSKKFSHGFVNRIDVNEPNYPDLITEEAKELGIWMGSLVCNLCLLMQSYPKYMDKLSKEKSERQNFKDNPFPQSIIIRRSTERKVFQVVVEKDQNSSISTDDREIGRHWRRGHWRRQPHGDMWELENPESKILVLKDGRHAHMRWILPVFVGINSEEKVLC